MIKKAILLFCMYLLMIFAGLPVSAFQLPDTGQHKCYDNSGNEISCPRPGKALHGQDAQYQSAEPSYRDNGNDTVKDLNTGLIWQQKDDHNATVRTWAEACEYCEKLVLGSKEDWRVPTKRELYSLVIYSGISPAIDPLFYCRTSHYWSSSETKFNPGWAWVVDFTNGSLGNFDKINGRYVRCVRSE